MPPRHACSPPSSRPCGTSAGPGAAALDLCAVACGRLDAYYEAGLEPWDLAAGEVIAREAGATVTVLEGLIAGASDGRGRQRRGWRDG